MYDIEIYDIDMFADKGTYIGEAYVRHWDGDIWELRPLSNHILLAGYVDGSFVLLHHFVNKSQKIPHREIKRAKQENRDYLRRKGRK